MNLINSQGVSIRLGPVIAKGGEGTVYSLLNGEESVAKIYNNKPSVEKVKKLQFMVEAQTPELLRLACWPLDLIFESKTRELKGFLMPRASKYKEIHKLYSPKSRSIEFQDVDWRFLISAATNMSRAFSVVHSQGHVIGDVNHSSVMVAADSTVRLIDCDSFQIGSGLIYFPCEAAEPLHRAPELAGQKPKDVKHTANHDSFGLAVLIFELLFMGRHPFSGSLSGGRDLSLEEKIQKYMFAYGKGSLSQGIRQPPNTLSLGLTSTYVASLFEGAFAKEGGSSGRPTAKDWVKGLIALQSTLTACATASAHFYSSTTSSCPWCEIERNTGGTLFYVRSSVRRSKFDLISAWAAISAVPTPGDMTPPDLTSQTKGTASPQITKTGRRNRILIAVAVSTALILGVSLGQVESIGTGAWILSLSIVAITIFIIHIQTVSIKDEIKSRKLKAEMRLKDLERHWQASARVSSFTAILQQLLECKKNYELLPRIEADEQSKLRQTIIQRELYWYLDKIRIVPGLVSGFGDGRCSTLRSYGVESAADIDKLKSISVPGVGPELSGRLRQWRDQCAAKFQHNPSARIDPRDQQILDQRMATLYKDLESQLASGPSKLEACSRSILSARNSLYDLMVLAAKDLNQARADLAAI